MPLRIIDLVGGGMVAVAFLGLASGGAAVAGIARGAQDDPRVRNLTTMAAAAAGAAVSVYTAYYLAWGMGGLGALLLFLVNFPRWTWTVVVTVALWTLITGLSLTCILRSLSKSPGSRNAVPYAKASIQLMIFGTLWALGAFIPVPSYRDFPLAWQAGWGSRFLPARRLRRRNGRSRRAAAVAPHHGRW